MALRIHPIEVAGEQGRKQGCLLVTVKLGWIISCSKSKHRDIPSVLTSLSSLLPSSVVLFLNADVLQRLSGNDDNLRL